MTAPLTPPDCDLRDFPRMMVDIPRLRGSDFDATPDDSAWRAGFNLWFTAWHQVPCASLSDDDASLAKAAGLGRDLRTWKKVRATALRGWVLCDDGRLYHPVVAEFALEAWIEKLGQRIKSGAGNERRWGAPFDGAALELALAKTVGLLADLNPASKAILKASRRDRYGVPQGSPHVPQGRKNGPTGMEKTSHREAETIPDGSQETVEGEENKRKKTPLRGSKESAADAPPPPRGCRLPADWQPSDIDRAYALRQGFTPATVERIAEKFRNYWRAKSGKAATKLDWPATWRNWVLEEVERRGVAQPAQQEVDWI